MLQKMVDAFGRQFIITPPPPPNPPNLALPACLPAGRLIPNILYWAYGPASHAACTKHAFSNFPLLLEGGNYYTYGMARLIQ